jgi:hypothetical protein
LVLGVEQLVLAVVEEKRCLAERLWEATRKSVGLVWDLAGVFGAVCSMQVRSFCAFLGNAGSNWKMEGNSDINAR